MPRKPSVRQQAREIHISRELNKVINYETGEILGESIKIREGGLYVPMGVPAYNILAQNKEHIAKNVLVALLSHLHADSNEVWPSITRLSQLTGHSRASVIKGNSVLMDYGFVYIWKKPMGKRAQNRYFILDACYHHELFNEKAKGYLPVVMSCIVCGKGLKAGEFRKLNGRVAHWGCSGNIQREERAKLIAVGSKNAIVATNPNELP